MICNNLPTSCLYNEPSTNGDEPKSPSFTPKRKGHLTYLHSKNLNFNNVYELYFYFLTLLPSSYFSISKTRNCFNNPRSVIENSIYKWEFIDPISSMKLLVIKRSSTSNTMTCNKSPICCKYALG